MSNAIQADHGELRSLVTAAFAAVGEDRADVEIHLKGRAATLERWIALCRTPGGCGRGRLNALPDGRLGHLATSRARAAAAAPRRSHLPPARTRIRRIGYAGTTYGGVPGLASVGAEVRWLVTLRMDRVPRREDYPRTTRYPGLKTAPELSLRTWQEELLAVAAHEARHVHQFRGGHRRSEIDAERVALAVLSRLRQGDS